MKESKGKIVEMLYDTKCRQCGKVKNHLNIKGIINLAGPQRKSKSIYEQIVLSEQVKPRMQEQLLCEDGSVKEMETITQLNLGESGVKVPKKYR